VHTFELPEENTTGLPEPPPVADKRAEPRTVPEAGAMKEIDWGALTRQHNGLPRGWRAVP
jgi:hypothetical protein